MPIQINGATSGSTTIQATDAVTQTITLPAQTGTVMVNGPAFYVTFSGTQSVTSNTLTKVTLNSVTFDTNSIFNTSTYRFTATTAGYYQFGYGVQGIATSSTLATVNAILYKNGTSYGASFSSGSFVYPLAADESCSTGTGLIYLNGTTDYVELYGKVIGTSPRINNAFLSCSLVRGA